MHVIQENINPGGPLFPGLVMIWTHCHAFPENIWLASRYQHCHILTTWSLLWLAWLLLWSITLWGEGHLLGLKQKGKQSKSWQIEAKQSLFNPRPQSKAIQGSFPDQRSCGIPSQINFSYTPLLVVAVVSKYSLHGGRHETRIYEQEDWQYLFFVHTYVRWPISTISSTPTTAFSCSLSTRQQVDSDTTASDILKPKGLCRGQGPG